MGQIRRDRLDFNEELSADRIAFEEDDRFEKIQQNTNYHSLELQEAEITYIVRRKSDKKYFSIATTEKFDECYIIDWPDYGYEVFPHQGYIEYY